MDRPVEGASQVLDVHAAHGDTEHAPITPIVDIGAARPVPHIPGPAGAAHIAQYNLYSAVPQPQPPETPPGYRWRVVSAEHRRTHGRRRLAVLERIPLGGAPLPDPPVPPAAAEPSRRRKPVEQSGPLGTRLPLPFPSVRVA
ncbi:MAG: hypothetical protein ABI068_11265 [Ktedonobacterales bacterium]